MAVVRYVEVVPLMLGEREALTRKRGQMVLYGADPTTVAETDAMIRKMPRPQSFEAIVDDLISRYPVVTAYLSDH